MQAELEKWITDNEIKYILRDRYGDSFDMVTAVPVGELRALFAGKVLCDAEPVAWQYQVNYTYCNVSWVLPPDDSYDEGTLQPLYAAADIGKPEPDYKAMYNELLYQVATVIPNETRHQTALRYIREREDRCNAPEVGESACKGKEGGE
jgi:hypothetical protein